MTATNYVTGLWDSYSDNFLADIVTEFNLFLYQNNFMDSEIAGMDHSEKESSYGDTVLRHFDELRMEMAMAFQLWDETIQDIWSEKE